MPCHRDLERRLHDINQKVVEAERKLREAESSTPDLSSSEKVRAPVPSHPLMVLGVAPVTGLPNDCRATVLQAVQLVGCWLQGSGELGTPKKSVPEPGAEWVDVGSLASFGLPDSPTALATPGEGLGQGC